MERVQRGGSGGTMKFLKEEEGEWKGRVRGGQRGEGKVEIKKGSGGFWGL